MIPFLKDGFYWGYESPIFKFIGIRRWAYHAGGIVVKAAIGGQNMKMGMKILRIANALHGDCSKGETDC